MNPKIDDFLNAVEKWQSELHELRRILLDCELTEELKWGVPCYTFEKNNVVLMHHFKDYCAIGFFKGVLLKDSHQLLIAQSENSQASRQIRFSNLDEIVNKESIIKMYLYEAIEIEKSGLKVDYTKNKEFVLCDELQQKLEEMPNLKIAFEKLTVGRQKAYNLYFESAKQSSTRITRIEKYIPQILNGKGINDCICGLSKKPPQCDGSHKNLPKD